MPRIFDEGFIPFVVSLIKARDPEDLPVDLEDEQVKGVIDLTDGLANFTGRLIKAPVGGLPVITPPAQQPDLSAQSLFSSQFPTTTQPAQAATFTFGGLILGWGAALPNTIKRLDLVYLRLRPSVDVLLELYNQDGLLAPFVGGVAIYNGVTSLQVGSTLFAGNRAAQFTAGSAGRQLIPANTVFEWPLNAPSPLFSRTAPPAGFVNQGVLVWAVTTTIVNVALTLDGACYYRIT